MLPINQGDIYWIRPDDETAELGRHPHPYVVVQDDLFNHSRIHTVVVCALSTNLGQANQYGNVLLDDGEGALPKQSVVVVSKISSVPKSQLGDFVGRLDPARVAQILGGLRLLQKSFMK
ncbi:MAG: type II toxin-antitoxin system PemK/MazF family toxin [Anaerolineales bacterium]|nr:type II toxin-antitoxin system PemK/MazF family toxin [Anaerolineales bacterium]